MGDKNLPVGRNDSSVETLGDDLFDISQYVNGLSDFIKACVTPMTISIQGDWGSGKTSMMNMVKDKLGEDVLTIWFNTWQYSQFNMGDELALSFIGQFVKKLRSEKEDTNKTNETFKKVYKAIKKAGLITVDHFVGGAMASELEQLADRFARGDDDTIDSIDNLKSEFKKSVENKLNETGKKRLVIFIDDLDRLNPARAVELLEVLKVFLDCENCIFILAIDYNVVCQGVKEKYGAMIGDDKGKNFFDKIIQVPFKMPVSHYNVNSFIEKMFEQVNINLKSDNSTEVYVGLIQASVGCNPRTMNRLFNAYLLLTYVSNNVNLNISLDNTNQGMWYKKILFGILCCQYAFEDLYNFLILNYDDFEKSNLLEVMCNPDAYRKSNFEDELEDEKQDYDILVKTFEKKEDEEIWKMAHFMNLFVNIIDCDSSKHLSDKELEAFVALLKLTTITSAGNSEVEVKESQQMEYRKLSRRIMTLVKEKVEIVIKSMNAQNKVNSVYQIRQDTNSFKSTWAEVWAYIYIPNHGHLCFESALTVEAETGKLGLKTWTKRRNNFQKSDYIEYLSKSALVREMGFSKYPLGIEKYIDDIGVISADSEEQKVVVEKVASIITEYLKNLY